MQGPVFLTGMMGSGKSTVGHMLARELGVAFVDLDQRIELVFGRSVEELFAEGEADFRRYERRALQSLVAEPAFSARMVIVATGGGAVVDPFNRRTMEQAGTVVYLEVSLDDLCQRLRAAEARRSRPLVASSAGAGLRSRLAELLAARRQAYRSADHIVDGSGSPSEVVARLRAALFVDDDTQAV